MNGEEEDTFGLSEGQEAEWNDTGTVTLRNGNSDVVELNPREFSELGDWVNEKSTRHHQIYFRYKHKDHIVSGGDTLCNNNVQLPSGSDSPDLTPFSETTEREWRVLLAAGSLCSGCRHSAARQGLLPSVPNGRPEFPCPECGEKTDRLTNYKGIGIARHDDGPDHHFDFRIFEEWRRNNDPEEIDSCYSPPAFR